MIAIAARPRALPGARRLTGETIWRDAAIVFAAALALRLLFAFLTADTYDPDEFVVLALSRDLAHGAVPYQSFMFFHPPGALVLFRLLQPLTALWWPAARGFVLLVDCASALLVWRIGCRLFERRTALLAGLIYAASPIPLLASVRIGQDSIITALGLLGLLLLLSRRSAWGAAGAGVCLGLAFWFKYPALLFLPVYALAAPRRIPIILGTAALAVLALFAPFAAHLSQLYHQSVGWQAFGRGREDFFHRVAAVGAFLIALNPLAVPGLLRSAGSGFRHLKTAGPWNVPIWVPVGLALGASFVLFAQVYYHYFVPVVPFAALLGAPVLARLLRQLPQLVIAGATALVGLWAGALNLSITRDGLGELSLGSIQPAVQLVQRSTGPHQPVLTDQFEYAYLAHRPSASEYFWDMQTTTSARALERELRGGDAVVATYESSSYPPGFVPYLENRRYPEIHTAAATIWFIPGKRHAVASVAAAGKERPGTPGG
jgi:4-amino-4-deoxy-L-arabinose transferase-like glycosyltransferase